MRAIKFAVFVLLAFTPQAIAQISSDDAEARLQAKEAAATQPANITNGALEKLVHQLEALQSQNADLEAKLAAGRNLIAQASQLKAQVDALTSEVADLKALLPKSALDEQEKIDQAIKEHRLVNGMTLDEANQALSLKFRKVSGGSDGDVYEGNKKTQTLSSGSITPDGKKSFNTTTGEAGTKYTLVMQDDHIVSWRSEPYVTEY